MIKTITLLPGVTLRCFQDKRFKHAFMSLQFVRKAVAEEAALNALIPAILLRGCEDARDLRDITLRLDDLYGASVGALVRRIGDYQTTGFSVSFIDDAFALDGDAIFGPMMDFVKSLLLKPLLENGVFRADFVEGEKKNLIATIESQLNNKRAYTMSQLLKKMCAKDPFGLPRLGETEQVAAITPESAYAHYEKVLAESPVEVFYVGAADPETVAQTVTPLFADLTRNAADLPAQTAFVSCGGGEFTEIMDVSQAKLAMGFATPITLRDPRFAAMQVCNTILGGGMTCKLFMNIREKMSLCYDIGSGYYGSKGIVTVSAGIDQSKETVVRQEIMRQLDAICQGDITEEELEGAKQWLQSGLRSTHDSPGAIEGYYSNSCINGFHMTVARHQQAIAAVTAEQVAQAAKTLTLDTVYFVKGAQ